MSEHPEFPQESPAVKYLVEQVSKIEDASTCATGYYKSVQKIIARLDKTDVELNKLHMVVTDLKKITDSDVIAAVIGKKSDDVKNEVRDGIARTCDTLVYTVSKRLDKLEGVHKETLDMIKATNESSKRIEDNLQAKLALTMTNMDKLVSDVRARTAPPLQTILFYMVGIMFLSFTLGWLFGKYLV